MTTETKEYEIWSRASGLHLGTYEAVDAKAAYRAMKRDATYESDPLGPDFSTLEIVEAGTYDMHN